MHPAVYPHRIYFPRPSVSPIPPDDCPSFRCNTTEGSQICIPSEKLCDFVNDCLNGEDEKYSGNCDFDDGKLCQWTVEEKDNIWKIQMPANKAVNGLITKDANNNENGGYIYPLSTKEDVKVSQSGLY